MLDALSPLLSALARLLLASGVPFPEFAERMKAHLVAAAAENGKPTDSRIAALTGLQRRDVARLRAFEAKPPKPNPYARLVAMWQGDPRFSDDGTAKVLLRSGEGASFEALAWAVRRDIHPRTMLDALVEAGTVVIEDDGQSVRLLQETYQPLQGSAEQIDYLARNVGDHLSAAADNVAGLGDPQFERAVHYSELTDDEVFELEAMFGAGQLALLKQINQRAADMKAKGPRGAARFRAGGYFCRRGVGESDAG